MSETPVYWLFCYVEYRYEGISEGPLDALRAVYQRLDDAKAAAREWESAPVVALETRTAEIIEVRDSLPAAYHLYFPASSAAGVDGWVSAECVDHELHTGR